MVLVVGWCWRWGGALNSSLLVAVSLAADLLALLRHMHTKVMELDDNIGIILDALDELELTHSTLVVYTSDHGDMLGRCTHFTLQVAWVVDLVNVSVLAAGVRQIFL